MSSALRLRYNTAKAGIVTNPRDWATSAGYEFWYNLGNADTTTAIGTANDGLDGYGWTRVNVLTVAEGTSGDFLSLADIQPTHIAFSAAADAFASPRIFGSYDHGLQASRFLGYMPTKLTLEVFARYSTATALQVNNTTDFFGMAGQTVVDAAGAGSAGCIRSGGNGSTFFLTSDNGSDAGANIDIVWHRWKIVYGATTTEWFVDDVSQGTIATEADIWPLAFLIVNTSGTNDMQLSWVRVFYS